MNTGYLRQATWMTLFAGCGILSVVIFGQENVQHATWFVIAAVALLCFGLYSAVAQINKADAIQNWPVVLVAITVGVLAKYGIIAGAMLATTGDWRYGVLAMAVAQIDPLSVAALENNGRMSERVRTILAMWAAFDDPVTACVTPMVLALMAGKIGSSAAAQGGWQDVAIDLLPFVAALVLVGGLSLWGRLRPSAKARFQNAAENDASQSTAFSLAMLSSVLGRLPSLAAILGWFVRPNWLTEKRLTLLSTLALYGATFLFGMVLADGVNLYEGVLLGVFTFTAQGVVAWLVVPIGSLVLRLTRQRGEGNSRLHAREVWHLALAQMSGITAIVISLNLEMFIDGAVATIAMVIIVVNILHFSVNWLFDRVEARFWPATS